MALANCSQCGKLFNKVAYEICPACIEQVEQDFEKVYYFLKENGASHIDVIHEGTGVDKKTIMKFLSEGRFEGVTISYKCESCGEAITSGRMCAKCQQSINAQIEKMRSKDSEARNQPGSPQYYLGHSSLDRYRKK